MHHVKYNPNISKFVIHPVGTTLFYCLKDGNSHPSKTGAQAICQIHSYWYKHTLSRFLSSVHSTLHLPLPFLGISLHYFLRLSHHHLPLIPLLSCMVSLSPSTCHLCILVLFFSKPPLTQTYTHASFSPDVFCFLLSRMFGTPAGKQWGLEPSNNIRGYMPYGHLQGDGFLFLFLPVFPSLAAKVKRPKESRRKTSSPAPVRSLTTEDSSEVCVDTIWKIPANVKLVHGLGGYVVCGMKISQRQWRWAVKTNNYLTFHITGEVYSWEDKAQRGRWGKWCCLATVRGELPKTGWDFPLCPNNSRDCLNLWCKILLSYNCWRLNLCIY